MTTVAARTDDDREAVAAATEAATPVPRSRGRGRGRLLGWLALAVVLLGALAYGVVDDNGPRSPGDRARDLAESIACPQCDGQSVADSDSVASKGIRERIEQRIAEGASDAQIRDELAAAYGERVLLTPGRSGMASLVWALPVAALVVALAGVALAFRRWRAGDAGRPSEADRALVDRARHGPAAAAGTGEAAEREAPA